MIDDSERREVAARLRGLDAHEWYNAADEVDALETAIGCCIGQDWQDQNWWHRLADLIDRPTATATMDYEAMEDGIPDCRIWTCNGCKESFPAYRGLYPTYCPVCGTELRDGD